MKTKNNFLTKLPNKLYQLLELSLKDIRCVLKDDYVSLDMDNWHVRYEGSDLCSVCMAGAVMHYSLKRDCDTPSDCLSMEHGPEIYRKLKAIDSLRTFEFDNAYSRAYNTKSSIPDNKKKKIDDWYYRNVGCVWGAFKEIDL